VFTARYELVLEMKRPVPRHAFAFPPCWAGSLCGRYGRHSHVRSASAARQYLDAYLSNLERWLSEWRIAINVSKSSAMLFAKTGRRIPKPRAVQLFGEPIEWVDDTRYLGVTLDKRLTWSKHTAQVRKKAAQRLGTLGPLLNRRSLSIRKGVVLYKQLIRPMMDYACPVWRFAARSRITKLQVLQFKCLRIATSAPWYVCSREIHDDLGVPYFSDHTRSLTERFDSKLADVGNPLSEQLGRHLRWPSVGSEFVPIGTFRLPWLRFFVIFLSCKANAGVKRARRGTARTFF